MPPAASFPPMLWFVVFPGDRDVAGSGWWWRLLRRDYRHCFAAAPLGAGTLVVNHAGRRLLFLFRPEPIGEFIAAQQRQHAAWIIAAQSGESCAPMLRGPMTCVEVCKALLGIRAPLILTPRQLSRHLLRLGGKPVLPNPAQEIAHGRPSE